jgi:hypothetical protein
MDAKKLLSENPLTKDFLKLWFLNKLMESIENFNEDDAFKDFMIKSGITDEQIETVFKEGGRAALDMFDEKEIFITIKHNWETRKFSYYINDKKESGNFNTRKKAESNALIEAVTILEENLTAELNNIEYENNK